MGRRKHRHQGQEGELVGVREHGRGGHILRMGAGTDCEVTGGIGRIGEGPRVDLKVRGTPFCLRCNWTGCYGQEQ